MTKKQISIVVFSSVGTGVLFLLCFLLLFWNPFFHFSLIKTYSNDSNYHSYNGTISELSEEDGKYCVRFGLIEAENGEVKKANDYFLRDTARIFSNDPKAVYDRLKNESYESVEFKTCTYTYEGFYLFPIVEISVGNEIVLPFEDGKAAILEYVKNVW